MSTATKTTLPQTEHFSDTLPTDHSVKVNVNESVGVIALSILFFWLFLAFLRSQRRERKLLQELAELYKKNQITN